MDFECPRPVSEAVKIGTIEWIYFEGGEPFLFYPIILMLKFHSVLYLINKKDE